MIDNFYDERKERIENTLDRKKLKSLARDFLEESFYKKYSYDFDWLGLPIIQYPEDIVQIQKLIWKVKPDLIIETGIARGGSLIFSASMLALLDLESLHVEQIGQPNTPRRVIGIDVDIRPHNRQRIEEHFLSSRIELIEGSSISDEVFNLVQKKASGAKCVMVFLDSNHTEEHVLEELNHFSKLVSRGSYIIVFDTVAEVLGFSIFPEKPWGMGNNPYTAVDKFLEKNKKFCVDANYDNLSMISTCQNGILKRLA